jgi:hypothetical protein
MIAIGAVILVDARAIAVDTIGQSTADKRQVFVQVVNCMRRRMSVNRELSYNAAMKVCKSQVNNESHKLVSVAVEASDSPAKP